MKNFFGKSVMLAVLCAALLTGCGAEKKERPPVKDCETTYTGVDLRERSLRGRVAVTLEGWEEPGLLLEAGECLESFPLLEEGEGLFTGSVEVPMDPARGFQLYLTGHRPGEAPSRELLERRDHVSTLLPLRVRRTSCAVPQVVDGTLRMDSRNCVVLTSPEREDAEAEAPEFRLYRNGVPLIAAEGKKNWDVISKSEAEGYVPDTKGDWTMDCAPGDEVLLTFLCGDGTGLGYEFALARFRVTGERVERLAPEEDVDPVLSWPEAAETLVHAG